MQPVSSKKIKKIFVEIFPIWASVRPTYSSSAITKNIIEKYRDKISKLIIEEDNGIWDAMNKGIKIAKGDIIGFLNSDDNVLIGGRVVEKETNIFKDRKNIIGGWVTWYGKTLKNFDTNNISLKR